MKRLGGYVFGLFDEASGIPPAVKVSFIKRFKLKVRCPKKAVSID
jgi:hypothetical protein